MISRKCIEIGEIIDSSPLRRDRSMSDFVGLSDELSTITQRLLKIKSEIESTLKVFVIGEVKSGKSTLINALVGHDVSPVNVLEATASIWEIGYAEQPVTTIVYKNGQHEEIEYKDLVSSEDGGKILLNREEEVDRFVVKTNDHLFKNLLLFDSPGLATVTIQNAELTKGIMQDIDLALWVFNANHLGQVDIMQHVIELAKLGKPIIAVINKIDEADDSPDDLIGFVSDHGGEYFQEIFAISAYQSLQNVKDNKDNKFTKIFNEFKQYLLEQIDKKSNQIKEDSVRTSLKSLIRTENVLHESALRTLENFKEERNNYIEKLNHEEKVFIDGLQLEIKSSCKSLVSDLGLRDRVKELIENNQPLDSLIKHNYIEIKRKVDSYYQEKTIDISERINKKIITRMVAFQENEQLLVQKQLLDYDIYKLNEVDAMETAKTATIVSAAGGVAAAGYAALLGANAAFITMTAALSAIALPVALVGGVGGLVYGLLKSKDNKEKLECKANQLQFQMVADIEQHLIDFYNKTVENSFNHVREEIMFSGLNEEKLNQSKIDIRSYIDKLSRLSVSVMTPFAG